MLADDELQDKPTAVHRPAARAQPATDSHSGWGSTSTEFSRWGGFGSRVRVDPGEMWAARERAAQRRAAHRTGVVVVGPSVTSWERGVQAGILGGCRRTGSRWPTIKGQAADGRRLTHLHDIHRTTRHLEI